MPVSKDRRGKRESGRRQGPDRGRQRGGEGWGSARADDRIEIYGFHAAEAALANPKRRINAVLATENAIHRLAPLLAARNLAPEPVNPRDLDRRLGPDAVHQGLLIEAEPLDNPTLADLVSGKPGILVVLDQVTDPHNVGAILRSAAAFGALGLIMTARHSPPLTGVLAKAASGALEHVPVALVPNLSRALAELADLGADRVGLDGEGSETIEGYVVEGPVALVLGAEGRGLRHLTRESCDRLARITTSGPLASLNVSNAAAVALHALSTQTGRCSSRPAR
jgi:23S rRNA (guanosine2251-2'-O)-methyltransferase